MAGMQDSPLRRLSPELRNRIYEMTFTSGDGITIDCRGEKDLDSTNKGFSKKITTSSSCIALTRTCHQIRQESLKMYYFLIPLNIRMSATTEGPVLGTQGRGGLRFPCRLRSHLKAYGRIIGKEQFSKIRDVEFVISDRKTEHQFMATPRGMDRDTVGNIQALFSTLTLFKVRFEMKLWTRSDACEGDAATFNFTWDVGRPVDEVMERLEATNAARAKFPSPRSRVSLRRIVMMVRGFVTGGIPYGYWID
jgi:hypothetical protein